jgi:hypothetical protein
MTIFYFEALFLIYNKQKIDSNNAITIDIFLIF